MLTLTINGKRVQAREGEMLLAAIRRESIDIPTLCQHDAVEPYGGCRLCMVEITREDWDGWTKEVTSCLYPVEDGLIVTTHSKNLIELRKTLLDLYLARNPKAELIQRMASDYGITHTSYQEVPDSDTCILCAICTRICDAMGFGAISTVNRGHGREIAPPNWQAPPDCVGCLACAKNCPTGFIEYSENGDTLEIWGKTFEILKCEKTGRPTITREFAEYLSEHRDIPPEYFNVNDETHRKELALTMGRISRWDVEEEKEQA